MVKRLRIEVFLEFGRKFGKKRLASSQQSGFDQGRLYSQVAGCLVDTLINGTDTVSDLQSNIPEQSYDLFKLFGERVVRRIGQ